MATTVVATGVAELLLLLHLQLVEGLQADLGRSVNAACEHIIVVRT